MPHKMALCLVVTTTVLSGCATVACDPDHPTMGKDCYECTRKAKTEAERDKDSHTSVKDRTENCLRERGYTKQTPEG